MSLLFPRKFVKTPLKETHVSFSKISFCFKNDCLSLISLYYGRRIILSDSRLKMQEKALFECLRHSPFLFKTFVGCFIRTVLCEVELVIVSLSLLNFPLQCLWPLIQHCVVCHCFFFQCWFQSLLPHSQRKHGNLEYTDC